MSQVRQRRLEAADAEHRESDERGGGVEAGGAVVDQREAAVERFQRAVREAVLDRGEDRLAVLTQGPREDLERPQATARRAADRAVEPGPGTQRAARTPRGPSP
jgi:hypothetical protein